MDDDDLVPEELMIEILSRLPVKALMRFKCVSKTFQNLILSPFFITRNCAQNRIVSHHLLIYCNPDFDHNHVYCLLKDDTVTDLHVPFLCTGYNIVGSCNGLVCVNVWRSLEVESPFLLWNPSTREFRHLPRPPPLLRERPDCTTSGFAFLPTIADYKLVRIMFYNGNTARFEIFTWSSNSWRVIENLECNTDAGSSGVIVKGSLYWTGDRSEFGDDLVFCFDMSEDKLRQIMMPPFSQDYTCFSLEVMKESVAMFVCPQNMSKTVRLQVWVMNDDGKEECWSKLFSIADTVMEYWLPKGFWPNTEVIIFGFPEKRGMRLYDHHTKETKEFSRLEGELRSHFFPYVETLVSPHWTE